MKDTSRSFDPIVPSITIKAGLIKQLAAGITLSTTSALLSAPALAMSLIQCRLIRD